MSGEDYDSKNSVIQEVMDITRRSKGSVSYKLQNCAACDVDTPEEDRPFNYMLNYQKLLKEVFDWYWDDRESARDRFDEFKNRVIAGTARTPPKKGSKTKPTRAYLTRISLVEEGTITRTTVNMRRRSSALVKEARRYFRQQDIDGKLRCVVCGYVRPESISREIIHIHHKEALMELNEDGREVVLTDYMDNLLPLCPNCHSLAHCDQPPLDAREIKSIIS